MQRQQPSAFLFVRNRAVGRVRWADGREARSVPQTAHCTRPTPHEEEEASMLVMKFGGTSVGGGRQLRGVAAIVARYRDEHPVVVASAMRGVTDLLLNVANAAAAGDRKVVRSTLRELRERHFRAVEEALDDPQQRQE